MHFFFFFGGGGGALGQKPGVGAFLNIVEKVSNFQ